MPSVIQSFIFFIYINIYKYDFHDWTLQQKNLPMSFLTALEATHIEMADTESILYTLWVKQEWLGSSVKPLKCFPG